VVCEGAAPPVSRPDPLEITQYLPGVPSKHTAPVAAAASVSRYCVIMLAGGAGTGSPLQDTLKTPMTSAAPQV
jgi:hypothetical protein